MSNCWEISCTGSIIVLKELKDVLSAPLCDRFNASLSQGKVPSIWKEANVTLIHKNNDPSDTANDRPISLLNTVEKVLGKPVHMFNFFVILTSCSSVWFIPRDSTVSQLVDIYNTFCIALDEGK